MKTEYAAYCASNGRALMMGKQLAQHKINVNNIALAAIPLSIKRYLMIPPQIRTPSVIPWGRFGRPEKVASVAVFLGSNEAEYVTGSTYLIDGGLTSK